MPVSAQLLYVLNVEISTQLLIIIPVNIHEAKFLQWNSGFHVKISHIPILGPGEGKGDVFLTILPFLPLPYPHPLPTLTAAELGRRYTSKRCNP